MAPALIVVCGELRVTRSDDDNATLVQDLHQATRRCCEPRRAPLVENDLVAICFTVPQDQIDHGLIDAPLVHALLEVCCLVHGLRSPNLSVGYTHIDRRTILT